MSKNLVFRCAAWLACPIAVGGALAGIALVWLLTSASKPFTIHPGASTLVFWRIEAIFVMAAILIKMIVAPPPFMLKPSATAAK